VKRIGRNRFIRNVLIAIGNSNDLSLVERRAASCWAMKVLWCAGQRYGRCRN
jgi:epoxyqueuosine reductase QueG